MAQAKVVDYNLLAAAGAAMVEPVSKQKETVFTKFMDKASEYLDFQREKTDEFINAMPDINMDKVDDKMLGKTTEFLTARREEIVKASETMSWSPKKSKKYKEAVISYNNATQAIVNYNSNLDLVLTHRQGGVDINGKYTSNTNKFHQINTNSLVNGTAFDSFTILENGNIQWNNYAHDPTSENPQESILLRDFTLPVAEDMSLHDNYMTMLTEVLSKKESYNKLDDEQKEKFELDQLHYKSRITAMINAAEPNQIKDMMFNGTTAKDNQLFVEGFLTSGMGSLNEDNPTKYNEDVFSSTDYSTGLGYIKGTAEYEQALEALKTGELPPEVIKEFEQYIAKSVEKEFEGFVAAVPPPEAEPEPEELNANIALHKTYITKLSGGKFIGGSVPIFIGGDRNLHTGGYAQVQSDGSVKDADGKVLTTINDDPTTFPEGSWVKVYEDEASGNLYIDETFNASTRSMRSKINNGLMETGNFMALLPEIEKQRYYRNFNPN